MRCIILLKFTTPLHIANVRTDYGLSETVIHSDTMYSAIIEAWNSLGLTQYIPKNVEDSLPFTISSLFPYATLNKKAENKSREHVYFLPRPASFNPEVSIELNKKVKKIEYIDAAYFKCIQEGKQIQINEKNEEHIRYNLFTDKKISFPLYSKAEQPRVRVSRSYESSEPFYIERIYFNENAGLYFFLEYQDESILKAIQQALNYLKDEGIGTDRNVGNGKFTWETVHNADIIYFDQISTDYSLNLSLYIPERHEVFKNALDDKSFFGIITRGGWITSYPYLTLRKKSIRAIKEGSILKIKQGISGRMADISPNKDILPEYYRDIHPVFRIGKSFWVPVKQ